jgi:D-alanyl-D-alanine carboxypeptidase
LLCRYFKKSKKKRKLKFGHYLVAVLIFSIIFFIRWKVSEININKDNDIKEPNQEEKTTTQTTTKKAQNNPNYIGTTPKGYTIEKINGAYYVDGYLVVNKTYPLDSNWVPKNTYKPVTDEICSTCIDNDAYDEWIKMKNDATSIGLNIWIQSGYRSYEYQQGLYEKYVSRDGKQQADTYSARPGHSEHQSGLSFDLNSVNDSFAATDEGKWVQDNAYLYGFIIRYPKDKSNETGYKYEPWHLRYVGKDLASKLYNNGDWITMETYFGIDSRYKD